MYVCMYICMCVHVYVHTDATYIHTYLPPQRTQAQMDARRCIHDSLIASVRVRGRDVSQLKGQLLDGSRLAE